MKHAIIGSLAGIAIVFALDSFARVIIATYSGMEILMFSYSEYGGVLWPVVLTIFAGLTSFLGGMFTLTFGRAHKKFALTFYLLLLIGLRYGQIQLLLPTESLFYPVTALVLSLGGVFMAWQLLKNKSKDNSTGAASKTHYHAPEGTGSGPDNESSSNRDSGKEMNF